jgi:hypothetical protein
MRSVDEAGAVAVLGDLIDRYSAASGRYVIPARIAEFMASLAAMARGSVRTCGRCSPDPGLTYGQARPRLPPGQPPRQCPPLSGGRSPGTSAPRIDVRQLEVPLLPLEDQERYAMAFRRLRYLKSAAASLTGKMANLTSHLTTGLTAGEIRLQAETTS